MPDEILVTLAPGTSANALAALAARRRLAVEETVTVALIGRTVARLRSLEPRPVRTLLAGLARERAITAAQPNFRFALQQTPPPVRLPQYAADLLDLPGLRPLATGQGVRVALIDSAPDFSHPELTGVEAERLDLLPASVAHAHGTAMAGAILSRAMLMGVAPQVKLLAAAAFSGSDGSADGSTLVILKAADWAAQQRARVANLSFAGPRDPLVSDAVKALLKAGVVVVAAAGNAGPASPPAYPAAEPGVIAVGAVDAQRAPFDRGNKGPYVAVSAPGVAVLAPAPAGRYDLVSGTSIAAAEVSGVVALLLQRSAGLSPAQVRTILIKTGRPAVQAGSPPLVDPLAALRAVPVTSASLEAMGTIRIRRATSAHALTPSAPTPDKAALFH